MDATGEKTTRKNRIGVRSGCAIACISESSIHSLKGVGVTLTSCVRECQTPHSSMNEEQLGGMRAKDTEKKAGRVGC